MERILTQSELEEGRRIAVIFTGLSEENKTMVMAYVAALRDKEIADSSRQLQEA